MASSISRMCFELMLFAVLFPSAQAVDIEFVTQDLSRAIVDSSLLRAAASGKD